MGDRWCDVSGFQRPERMRWADWGIPRGQYRLILGRHIDPAGYLHRANMRAAAMLTGPYGVPVEYAPIVDQAWAFVDAIPDDDENDDWADAERVLLTEPMLRAYCDTYDLRSNRQRLAIYTGYPWWVTHVSVSARARYARYKLIIGAYPFDTPAGLPVPMDPASVALRSNPPTNRRPRIPPPWPMEDGWQHTGQGSLPGYNGFIDLGIYRVNPSGPPAPDPVALAIRPHIDSIKARLGI